MWMVRRKKSDLTADKVGIWRMPRRRSLLMLMSSQGTTVSNPLCSEAWQPHQSEQRVGMGSGAVIVVRFGGHTAHYFGDYSATIRCR